MPVSAAERRFVLDNLTRLAEADIQRMWRAAELQTDLEFAAYVTQAFPDIVDPYQQMAAQLGATFFEEDFPAITTAAVLAAPLPTEQLTKSAAWALAADGVKAIGRMSGTTQRAIYDGERDTTAANASKNRMKWVRVARPDACAFCRLLASRAAAADGQYNSEQSARFRADGKKYHDDCHCTAAAIPRGEDPMDYLSATEPQFADLAAQWSNEYDKARGAAESGDPKKILAEWRAFSPEIS